MNMKPALATTLLTLSGHAAAHPGEDHAHGFIDGLLHTVSSADHLLIACAAGVFVGVSMALLRRLARRSSERQAGVTVSAVTPGKPASRQTK